jgi:phospholipase C
MTPKIKRLFVLMMENRSYDNLFGYSNFSGWTPEGESTTANGLTGKPSFTNTDASGHVHTISSGAQFRLGVDPGHEFSDVLAQSYGVNSVSAADCINDSASVASVVDKPGVTDPNLLGFAYNLDVHQIDVGSSLRCFSPDQLPVLNFLARQYAVCDSWFSSVPGPTWPNRFFATAGTSWGLDHSPTDWETVDATVFDGKTFGNGSDSLFTRLTPAQWLIAYDDIPQSSALTGMREHKENFIRHEDFITRLKGGQLGDANFVFIEPNYAAGLTSAFYDGNSMHPEGDVRNGEALIKTMYEAIKDSPYWEECVFLVVFDEHGGFFDHVIPTDEVVPAKNRLQPTQPTALTKRGFEFDRYGFRVPAVVISPYVKPATIDHSFYDHASIAKTLNLIVNQQNPPLLDTPRYAQADDFGKIFTLTTPRSAADIPSCPDPVPLDSSNTRCTSESINRAVQALNKLNWMEP